MALLAAIGRIILRCVLLCMQVDIHLRNSITRQVGFSLCLSLSRALTLAFSPTHAVVLSNHRFRFTACSPMVQSPASLVGTEQNMVGSSGLMTMLQ